MLLREMMRMRDWRAEGLGRWEVVADAVVPGGGGRPDAVLFAGPEVEEPSGLAVPWVSA